VRGNVSIIGADLGSSSSYSNGLHIVYEK